MKKKLIFFGKKKKLNKNIDYYGGIDWKKYIYWAEEIKKGGYILMFRHAEREKWGEALGGFDAYELYSKTDARNTDWYRATCLTERGIETAKNTGRAFKNFGIKIQKFFQALHAELEKPHFIHLEELTKFIVPYFTKQLFTHLIDINLLKI